MGSLHQAPPGPGTPLGPDPTWDQAPPGISTPPQSRHHPGPGTPLQAPPRQPPVDRHTPVNILPCPKLRLRAVIIYGRFPSQYNVALQSRFHCAFNGIITQNLSNTCTGIRTGTDLMPEYRFSCSCNTMQVNFVWIPV